MKIRHVLLTGIIIGLFVLFAIHKGLGEPPANPMVNGEFYPPRTFGKVGPLNYNPY